MRRAMSEIRITLRALAVNCAVEVILRDWAAAI
jgi:hypothetical protein